MINSGDKKLIFLLESILLILPISLIFSNLISEILIFLIIVIFFTQVKKDEIQKILNNKIFIFLFLITIYLAINYLLNISKESSFTRSIFFIRFPLYVISLSYFLNKNYINKKKIFFAWGFIVFLICLDLLLQNSTGKNILGYEHVPQGEINRLGGLLNDELKIAYILNNLFVISLGSIFLYAQKNIYSLSIILFLTILVLYSVYLTGERSNFISLVLFVTVFFTFSNLRKYFITILIILIPIMVIKFSSSENNPKIHRMFTENIKNIKESLVINKEENFLYKDNHYFAHFSTALQIFQDYPIIGVGLKNFRKYCNNPNYDEKIYPSFRNRKCATHPHNIYFEIMSELGAVGIIIFFGSFLYIFYIFLETYIKKKNIFVLGNTIILMTFFIPFIPKGSFFTNWTAMIFWTVFAINCHLISKKKNS